MGTSPFLHRHTMRRCKWFQTVSPLGIRPGLTRTMSEHRTRQEHSCLGISRHPAFDERYAVAGLVQRFRLDGLDPGHQRDGRLIFRLAPTGSEFALCKINRLWIILDYLDCVFSP